MNVGAYVLARFSDHEKLLPAIGQVRQCDHLQRWNAVDGHVNLVIKLKSSFSSPPDLLKKMEGVKELLPYEIETDHDTDTEFDPRFCYTYLFIESESAKIQAIFQSLTSMSEIVSSSVVRGGCDIIAVVKGSSFLEINRTLDTNIRHLDGILRLKADRVIDLKTL
jgi:hypothetical protein